MTVVNSAVAPVLDMAANLSNADVPKFDADGLPVIPHRSLRPDWLATLHEEALEPALPIVDPHHHLWEREGGYLLDELLADLGSGHNIVATVFAQCGYAYRSDGPVELRPVGETELVARVTRAAEARGVTTQICAGIVGYADLELGDAVAPVLQAHIEAGNGRFRGTRHITALDASFNASLLGRPAQGLMARPGFRRGVAQLQAHGLSFDAWLYHPQIDELVDLARAFPELPIVLNHLGGPLGVGPYAGKSEAVFTVWKASLKRLADCPNVVFKLGGLAMAVCGYEFHQQAVPASSAQLADAWAPYFHTAIEIFGAQRCMFESNFPVDKAMSSYTVLWNTFKRAASGASATEKDWLFRGTANAFYRLGLLA